MSSKWDIRFLQMAKLYASWSKDPSSQIGCVIVEPNTRRILSGGYNGFPRGICDNMSRLNDKPTKYKYVVHAEQNAIYNATYSGVQLAGSTLYCSGLPTCSECAKGVIQVGISRVVCVWPDSIPERWLESWDSTKLMFEEVDIEWEVYNDRYQSVGSSRPAGTFHVQV